MYEIWKDIPGYEGLYQINNTGIIKSLMRLSIHNRHKTPMVLKEKILKVHLINVGYYIARLCDNNDKKFLVHILVAKTFIPNPENKPQVNHKNGIKTDNRVENLEWCTRSENLKHSFKIGLKSNKGEKNPNCKLTNYQIEMIRNNNNKQEIIARQFGITQSHISSIKNYKKRS
jgi:hypothetical protein